MPGMKLLKICISSDPPEHTAKAYAADKVF